MMMARSRDVHTAPNPAGSGWVNQVGGEIVSRPRTKEPAVERGRERVRHEHSEHAIHNRNGQIGRKNSYVAAVPRIRT
jgi:hypothetical protein